MFYEAWGRDRKDIPKRRIIPTILRRVITQKSYNISFIVVKASDHLHFDSNLVHAYISGKNKNFKIDFRSINI